MEHVVFFPAPDGTPAFRRVPALEDAVRLVEHLRNVEGVAEVSVHPLGAEVPLAFRTWYRVEVPTGAAPVPAQPVGPAPEVPVAVAPEAHVEEPAPAPVVEPAAEPVAEAPEPAGEPAPEVAPVAEPVAAGNGHRDVTSLGFFAT